MKQIAGILIFCTAPMWAITPKLLDQTVVGDNTVYTYEVSGEDITDPNKTSNLYGMSDLAYALCSKALCTVDKTNNKATCICPVYGIPGDEEWQKASVGPKDLAQTQPTTKNGKLETVVSNYSMANTGQKKASQTTCRFTNPTPWANCYGVRCNVEYAADGSPVAVCDCPLVKTDKFVSIGPKSTKCCTKEAPEKAWSAATKKQGANNNYIITDIYQDIAR